MTTAKEKPQKSETGLEPNVAALLAYLFFWIGGLIIYLVEKDNKFVRFAAMQSIVLSVAMFAAYTVVSVVVTVLGAIAWGLGALFSLVWPVISIGFLIVWIILMVKAYQNEEWELPIIGKIARNVIK